MKNHRLRIIFILLIVSFFGITACDDPAYKIDFVNSDFFKGLYRGAPQENSNVGFCQSNDNDLGSLASPLDATLSYEQVDAVTRKAVVRAGGLESVMEEGDEWVLIKPNMVEHAENQNHIGVATDLRVVKSIIQQLIELPANKRPKRITVGEGGGSWAGDKGFTVTWPEYDALSYDGMLKEFGTQYPEIEFDWIDFNNESDASPYAEDMPVPGGRLELETYTVPQAVLQCDKFIIVSVMKTHEMVKATMTHKNYIGISPSSVYGTFGLSHFGIPHGATLLNKQIDFTNTIDRSVVDLFSFHPADFAVVECFWGTEETGPREGWEIKRNMVIAGADPLATDAVGAYYMGFNPYDFDYLHWSWMKGFGNTFDLAYIALNGPDQSLPARTGIDKIRSDNNLADFVKQTLQPHLGRGIRMWLLNGPHDGTDINYDYLGGEISASPEKGDVTAGKIWELFADYNDYMDLGKYYKGPSSCMTYAYTNVYAEKALDVELRFASDNGIKIFLNGQAVYTNCSTGDFPSGQGNPWYEEKVGISLNAGKNRLLVKIYNKSNAYGFSMYVTEADADTPIEVSYELWEKDDAVGTVYWVELGDTVNSMNPDGTNAKTLVSNASDPDGIDIDADNGKMYWTNMADGTIMKANFDGTDIEEVVPTGYCETPKQLALDLTGRMMYWCDRDSPKVMKAGMDGSDIEIIVSEDIESPVGMALDIDMGKLYFSDRYAGNIKRANLNGSDVETVLDGLNYPVDLALDLVGRQIYWTARQDGKIFRANMDGSGKELVVQDLNEPIGVSLDLENNKMYYTNINLLLGNIFRSDMDGTGQEELKSGGIPLGICYSPPK